MNAVIWAMTNRNIWLVSAMFELDYGGPGYYYRYESYILIVILVSPSHNHGLWLLDPPWNEDFVRGDTHLYHYDTKYEEEAGYMWGMILGVVPAGSDHVPSWISLAHVLKSDLSPLSCMAFSHIFIGQLATIGASTQTLGPSPITPILLRVVKSFFQFSCRLWSYISSFPTRIGKSNLKRPRH